MDEGYTNNQQFDGERFGAVEWDADIPVNSHGYTRWLNQLFRGFKWDGAQRCEHQRRHSSFSIVTQHVIQWQRFTFNEIPDKSCCWFRIYVD
ncbi:hypothetical protein Daus18300_012872 [Diaporthe australafricana]|uniref:Uncharacterized protein n=1 Tax=Diaporthe australafricana TaxID=127596 RepID=A0ABR3W192_9PEZI